MKRTLIILLLLFLSPSPSLANETEKEVHSAVNVTVISIYCVPEITPTIQALSSTCESTLDIELIIRSKKSAVLVEELDFEEADIFITTTTEDVMLATEENFIDKADTHILGYVTITPDGTSCVAPVYLALTDFDEKEDNRAAAERLLAYLLSPAGGEFITSNGILPEDEAMKNGPACD